MLLRSLCQGLLHRFRIPVNDLQQGAGGLVRNKWILLPIAHNGQRQPKYLSKLFLREAEPLPDRSHIWHTFKPR